MRIHVNPYTGEVLGDNSSASSGIQQFFKTVFELHYSLLASDFGTKLVGMIGLLMCILTITGMMLWPGWHKLLNGFRIKRCSGNG